MKNNDLSVVTRDKKAYISPRLSTYGSVKSLTQSARSGAEEGSSGNNPHMAMSDRRLKHEIVRVGRHPAGFGLYLFYFKPEHCDRLGCGRQFGVMADEVEQVMPEAVSMHPDGYKMVDYAMLGISRNLH